MKRLLMLLLLLMVFMPLSAHAQVNPQQGHGAPTGVCLGPYVDMDTGNFYVCKVGQYALAGGSSGSNPALAIIASPLCPTSGSTVCNFVNFNMHFSSTASVTNGQKTITLPNADWNFNSTDANGKPIAKVGQIVEVTTSGGAFLNQMGTRVVGQDTIASINGNTSISTTTNTANATLTGTAWVAWGDDDSANLATFWTNVGCGRGILPGGYAFVQQAEFITAPVANCSALSNSVFQAPSLQGQSVTGTWIVPTFNFNAATCTSTSFNGCFGGTANTDTRDLTIWGFGDPRTASGTTHAAFVLGAASRAYNVDIEYWATAEANWTGVVFTGNQDIFQLGGSFGVGGLRAAFVPSSLTGPAESIGNFWTNVGASLSSAAVDIAGPMYELDDFLACTGTCAASHLVEVTGNSTIYSSVVLSETGVSAARVDGVENIHDSFFGQAPGGPAAPASTFAIFTQNAAAKIFSETTVFSGGAGGGSIDLITSGSKFIDGCGNTFSGSLLLSAGTTFIPCASPLASTYSSVTAGQLNCASSVSPAACGSYATGSVAVAAASATLVVNTTAIDANSQIVLTEDASLGTKLGVTCNATPTVQPLTVTARTAGTSFTFSNTSPTTNPRCVSYQIIR